MAEKIEKDGVLYAILHRKEDWKKGLAFLTPTAMFCQVGVFWYQKGKRLETHRHIRNERINNVTQECFIVMSGSLRVDLYGDDNQVFRSEILNRGDLMVLVAGAHGFEILETDTKIIECKNGPFISVEKDKQLI